MMHAQTIRSSVRWQLDLLLPHLVSQAVSMHRLARGRRFLAC